MNAKLQAPSSKLQINPKLQAPTKSRQPLFGAWNLELIWSLELGTWSFLALLCLSLATPAAAFAADSLFDDPVIVRGKGLEIRRGRLEEAFIHHKANLASRGKSIAEGQ